MTPTQTALLAEANRLDALASEYAQGDQPTWAQSCQQKAAELRKQAGIHYQGNPDSHVWAYEEELRSIRRRAQVLAASPRLRAALSDIYGGRLNFSLNPRNRIAH